MPPGTGVHRRPITRQYRNSDFYTGIDGEVRTLGRLPNKTRVAGDLADAAADLLKYGSVVDTLNAIKIGSDVAMEQMLKDPKRTKKVPEISLSKTFSKEELDAHTRRAKCNATQMVQNMRGKTVKKQTFVGSHHYFFAQKDAPDKVVEHLESYAGGRAFLTHAKRLYMMFNKQPNDLRKLRKLVDSTRPDGFTSEINRHVFPCSQEEVAVLGGGDPTVQVPLIKEERVCMPGTILVNEEKSGIYDITGDKLDQLPKCNTALAINSTTQDGTPELDGFMAKYTCSFGIEVRPGSDSKSHHAFTDDKERKRMYDKRREDMPWLHLDLVNGDALVFRFAPVVLHVPTSSDPAMVRQDHIKPPGSKVSKVVGNVKFTVTPKYDGVLHQLVVENGFYDLYPRTKDSTCSAAIFAHGTVSPQLYNFRLNCMIEIMENPEPKGRKYVAHVTRVVRANGRACSDNLAICCALEQSLDLSVVDVTVCKSGDCLCPCDGVVLKGGPREQFHKFEHTVDCLDGDSITVGYTEWVGFTTYYVRHGVLVSAAKRYLNPNFPKVFYNMDSGQPGGHCQFGLMAPVFDSALSERFLGKRNRLKRSYTFDNTDSKVHFNVSKTPSIPRADVDHVEHCYKCTSVDLVARCMHFSMCHRHPCSECNCINMTPVCPYQGGNEQVCFHCHLPADWTICTIHGSVICQSCLHELCEAQGKEVWPCWLDGAGPASCKFASLVPVDIG